MNFWTLLKHHIFRLHNKLEYIFTIFWINYHRFCSNSMARGRNLKTWRFLNILHEQKSLLSFIIFQFYMECLKYKALKITFGRSQLLPQNYKILQKFGKNHHKELWTNMIGIEKDLICLDNLFSMAQCTYKTERRNMFVIITQF